MNPIITKRCSPIEEAIYQDGFQAGAASRDAEVSALEFSWAGCSQQLKDACADLEEVEQERDQLRAHINMLRDAFQTFIDEHEECQDADEWMAELCSMEALHVAGEALATTPEQSLAAYREAVAALSDPALYCSDTTYCDEFCCREKQRNALATAKRLGVE